MKYGVATSANTTGLQKYDFFFCKLWKVSKNKFANTTGLQKYEESCDIRSMPIWRGAKVRKYPNNVIYLVGRVSNQESVSKVHYVHDPWISRYLIFIQGFVSWDAIYYVTHFKPELWHCHKCQYERALQTYWVPEKGLPLPAEKWWDEQSCKMSQISQIYRGVIWKLEK